MIDICNIDESKLFYKASPNRSLTSKCEWVEEGKAQKDWLTLIFTCYMNGNDKYIFCNRSSIKATCFQSKIVSLPYYANKKFTMTNELWNNMHIELNKPLKRKE